MKYYEDDRPRSIPEEYLRMTAEELECESERVYQEYRKKHPRPEKTKETTCSVQFYF